MSSHVAGRVVGLRRVSPQQFPSDRRLPHRAHPPCRQQSAATRPVLGCRPVRRHHSHLHAQAASQHHPRRRRRRPLALRAKVELSPAQHHRPRSIRTSTTEATARQRRRCTPARARPRSTGQTANRTDMPHLTRPRPAVAETSFASRSSRGTAGSQQTRTTRRTDGDGKRSTHGERSVPHTIVG